MQIVADQPHTPTAIRTDLGAIFVSLELSRSIWLITSLSPGGGERMSKHSLRGGDVAGLLERFAQIQEKARARTGQRFPIIVVQEAGLDGFWIHRALQAEGIESHVVDPASIATSRRRRRAKTDRIDGEARSNAGGSVAQHQGRRTRVRRRPLVGRALPTLRQPTTGRGLCRPGADPLAERICRSRARGFQGREPATAHNTDPAGVAVVAPPAALGSHPVVRRTGQAQWGPSQEDDDRGARPKAVGCALEICDCRCRHRRRRTQGRLRNV